MLIAQTLGVKLPKARDYSTSLSSANPRSRVNLLYILQNLAFLKMKVIAAYLLAVLGGNTSPCADDLKGILGSGLLTWISSISVVSVYFYFENAPPSVLSWCKSYDFFSSGETTANGWCKKDNNSFIFHGKCYGNWFIWRMPRLVNQCLWWFRVSLFLTCLQNWFFWELGFILQLPTTWNLTRKRNPS